MRYEGVDSIRQVFEKERELWRKACDHDHVEVRSQFVIFSEDNPFIAEHDRVSQELQRRIAEIRAG